MRDLGYQFEEQAKQYLQAKGLEILETNWHAGRHGEIDIIAFDKDKSILIFVEVKGRRGKHARYDALHAITQTKATKILKSIDLYIEQTNIDFKNYRFDFVMIHEGGLEHWDNVSLEI